MITEPGIGPVALCVVVCADLDLSGGAYANFMALSPGPRFPLDQGTANALGMPELGGCTAQMLSNGAGREWLMQVEYPEAIARDALASYGWMAQELLVEDVDTLAASLDVENSPFELLRPPRDLDMSSLIRACQVRGPDGEILYLTQVNGEVPGSQLPQGAQGVDHLFIAVLSSPDCEASLREYEQLSGSEAVRFDTRISVVNQHRGWDIERKHPIATVQLAGRSLIEIDGLPDTVAAPAGICLGTAGIVFRAGGDTPDAGNALENGPLAGYVAVAKQGAAGERYTLLFTPS